MKIAFLIPWFLPNRGGAEIGAWELGRRLVQRGHEVALITPRFRLDWPAEETIDGIQVMRYFSMAPSKLKRLSEAAHSLQAVPGVFQRLNRFQPDLVHLHYLFFTGYPGMLWSLRNRRPTVVTLVGNDIYDPYYIPCAFLSPLNHWLLKHADRVVAASTFVQGVIEAKFGIPKDKLPIVPYGVDIGRFHPVDSIERTQLRSRLGLSPEGPIVLTVQRLHERKGVSYYLDAIARVLARRPEVRFVVVGGGPERDALEQKTKSLGIEKSVHFTGRVSDADLPLYYQACDLFAFHTLHEGFGIVLLEAMACAKPVITTRAGGTLDIVQGEGGQMVEPKDVPALAQAILDSLANPGHWGAMGEANRKRVETHFNWETITDTYLQHYQSAMPMVTP